MNASLSKYTAFFGRKADIVLQPDPTTPKSCYVYRFPPAQSGFLSRFFTPLRDTYVYVTDGMSLFDMVIPTELQKIYPKRIELLACTKAPITGGLDKEDIVTRLLQVLVSTIFRLNTFAGPLQTVDLGEKMCPNSEMTGFLFGVPGGIDMPRLCRCTQAAQLVVSVIPITAGELKIVKEKGPTTLVTAFEREGVENVFDPFRQAIAGPF